MNKHSLGWTYLKQLFENHHVYKQQNLFLFHYLICLYVQMILTQKAIQEAALGMSNVAALKYNNLFASLYRHVKNGFTETGQDNLRTF